MATNYISTVDTAKMIRKALKEAFPETKFSVRSSIYSGGSSISIGWTDGPNNKQVEAVAETFEGSYFDGMQDYKGSLKHMIDGKEVHFGADFVFCNPHFSDARIQKAIDLLYTKYRGNFESKGIAKPSVDDYRNGRCWNAQLFHDGAPYDRNVQQEINGILYKISDYAMPEKSPTAGKVIFCGNDGYSQNGALNEELLK